MLKNCNFYVPDGDFCQKPAVSELPTAVFIKNLQFLSSRRLFSSKNRSFPLIRALRSTVFLVFRSSEASETLFFAFSAHPSPRKHCFSRFPLIRALGSTVFLVFRSSEASETLFFAFSAHPSPRESLSLVFYFIKNCKDDFS